MTILDRAHLTGAAAWPLAAWPKTILAALTFIAEAFSEARQMEREAHRRHPFTDWS